MAVWANCRYARDTVLQVVENIVRYLVRMRGYDREPASRLSTLDDIISYKAWHKAIEHAQTDGLIIVNERAWGVSCGVNKEWYCSYDGVENKGYPKEPGDIRGTIYKDVYGQIRLNTINGIYGEIENTDILNLKQTIEVAYKDEIKKGKAEIYCTLEDNETKAYDIEYEIKK